MNRQYLLTALAALVAAGPLVPRSAASAQFADTVISYTPGAGASAPFTSPQSALGSPDDLTGEGLGFPNVLSPFSPPFEGDEIVQIGGGGQLTLRLSHYAVAGAGPELGIFENVGLVDVNFPQGQAANPAITFNAVEDSAVVEVSRDGVAWSALAGGVPISFTLPSIYYSNAGPFDTSAPAVPLLADFGVPFEPAGGLAAFNGLNYAQIVALLGGSAGGTWLDLSGTGLAEVAFIRFSVPIDGNLTLDLDAVSISNSAVGAIVPEPASLALFVSGGIMLAAIAWRRLLKRASLAMVALPLALAADGAVAATIIAENFSDNPIAAGRATVLGDAGRFAHLPAEGAMLAHYNTVLPTAELRWPLGRTLSPAEDFRYDVSFLIRGDGFFADPNQFGQIAFGLIHSTNTGTDRPGGGADPDAFSILTLDYFPNISPQFGGPSLTPTIIQTDNGSGFFNRIVFPPDSESKLDDAGESDLPRDVSLTASMAYDAALQIATLRMTGTGGPLPINVGGGALGEPGGPDGDPTTIQLFAPPNVLFAFDTFALTLWRDTFGGATSSVRGDLDFDSFAVYDSLVVPEPSSFVLAAACAAGSLLLFRRRFRRARIQNQFQQSV